MNGAETPLLVWIEPYCEEIAVPPGSTLVISFELASGEDDQTLIELTADRLIYWCGGTSYEANLDGKRLRT